MEQNKDFKYLRDQKEQDIKELIDEHNILKRFGDILESWRNDPVKFVREAIGVDKIDVQQEKILNNIRDILFAKVKAHRIRVGSNEVLTDQEQKLSRKTGIAVDSARGVGKTTTAAWALIWWLMLLTNNKVVCVAPKRDLLKDNLWGEIAKWKRHSIGKFGHQSFLSRLEVQGEKVFVNNKLDEDGKRDFAIARTASKNAPIEDQESTISGYHADYLLIIVDESYGVPSAVFNPLEATLTGPVNFLFLIGNPTKNYGYARDAFKDEEFFIPMRITAEDSSLISDDYLYRMKKRYEDAPNLYRVNILGLPPLEESDSLIPFSKITEAVELSDVLRDESYDKEGLVFGLDVGGGGDLTVLMKRQGIKVFTPETFNNSDTMVVAGWVERHMDAMNPVRSGIDGIGIGRGVYDRLRQLGHPVDFVDARSRSSDNRKYKNLRAQLYWTLRELFMNGGIAIPNCEPLIRELSMLKLVDPGDNSVIQILSKKEMKKEGIESPNYADALMLTMFYTNHWARARKEEEVDVNVRYREQTVTNSTWMSH